MNFSFICLLLVLFVGVLFCYCMCVTAKKGDDDMDRLFAEFVPKEKPRNTFSPHMPRPER